MCPESVVAQPVNRSVTSGGVGSDRLLDPGCVVVNQGGRRVLDVSPASPVFGQVNALGITAFGKGLEIVGCGSAECVYRLVVIADDHERGWGRCEQLKEADLRRARVLILVNDYEPELLLECAGQTGIALKQFDGLGHHRWVVN